MSHWWKYPLSEVIPFSLSAYYRLLESHGQALWPLHLVMLVLGLLILTQLVSGGTARDRLILTALGSCWLLVAWLFFHETYAAFFWAAPFLGAAFAIQGIALLTVSLLPAKWTVGAFDRRRRIIVSIILALSLFAYPSIGFALRDASLLTEAFGLFPDPTAAATLAVLAGLRGGLGWALMIIPVIWCAISVSILLTLGDWTSILLIVLAASSLITALLPGPQASPQRRD